MATSQFDRLPNELQLMVMGYLTDPKTLYSMARVNSTWNAYAINQLWAYPPQRALEVLATLRPKSRRQFFASKVRSLSLQKPKPAFKTLVFDSLTTLSFSQRVGSGGSDQFNYDSFIQPSLHSLSYCGEQTLTLDSVNLVRLRCPNLRSLTVYDDLPFDSEVFVGLLQSLHHLQSLCLGYRVDLSVVQDVLACLAGPMSKKLEDLNISCSLDEIEPSYLSRFLQSTSRLRTLSLQCLPSNERELLFILCSLDTLQELELGHDIQTEQVPYLFHRQSDATPFKNVHTLSLQGDAQAVVKLLSSRTITSLTLEIEHPDQNFYTAIGSMVQMKSLDITLPPAETVTQRGLEQLSTLLNLQRLHMSRPDIDDVLDDMLQLPWMTDELFGKFVANFPLLEQLNLYWDVGSQLSELAIDALARHCTSLERTMLMWHHNLDSWHSLKRPLFPKLDFLGLGSISEFAGSSYRDALKQAKRSATTIRALVPVMNEFAIFSDSISADALSNTLFPGSVISQTDFSDDESASSLDDSDG